MSSTAKNMSRAGSGARARWMRTLLHAVFRVERLREGQQQVIDSVLAGRDTLAIMPTGSGKSLCYQIPATMLPGATIVVSPLIALMKDQLEKVAEVGIDAAQVNSSLSRAEERAALDSIRGKFSDIVFCTPERLTTPDFLALLENTPVSLVVVVEAHCISQWGDDFRPAYLALAPAICALGRPPILALTATATQDVIDGAGERPAVRGRQRHRAGGGRRQNHHRVPREADQNLHGGVCRGGVSST